MDSTNITWRVNNYERTRTTITTQFTKLLNKLNNHEIDPGQVDGCLKNLDSIWTKFVEVQENIELLTNDTELDDEINYKMDIEEVFIKLKIMLQAVATYFTFEFKTWNPG